MPMPVCLYVYAHVCVWWWYCMQSPYIPSSQLLPLRRTLPLHEAMLSNLTLFLYTKALFDSHSLICWKFWSYSFLLHMMPLHSFRSPPCTPRKNTFISWASTPEFSFIPFIYFLKNPIHQIILILEMILVIFNEQGSDFCRSELLYP